MKKPVLDVAMAMAILVLVAFACLDCANAARVLRVQQSGRGEVLNSSGSVDLNERRYEGLRDLEQMLPAGSSSKGPGHN